MSAYRQNIDSVRLESAVALERAAFVERSVHSRLLFEGSGHLLGGVPMTWMNKWNGGYPLYYSSAVGNRITDVDGNIYIDFALGDTGAMAGHSPAPVLEAINRHFSSRGGFTTMMPTEDGEWVASDLTERFGLPLWSFSLSATDANRWAIRVARMVTGRSKVLVFSYSYHGSVDETFAVVGDGGETVLRPGNVGAPHDISSTTRAAEFNDLESVERQLAAGDVAVVVTEPAMTNIGIVLPEPGFHEGLRSLCDKYGVLLLIDETHTFSAGYGGCTRLWGLRPDLFVIGKSIGGGIPSGAYGISFEVAQMIKRHSEADMVDVGGVGGTLAGNSLSLAAMRSTLADVFTESAFSRMIDLAGFFTAGVEDALVEFDVPWSVSQLGARVEYRFASPAPRNGTESAAAHDEILEEYLHLFMLNRGIIITPFHNMALMCPETGVGDVDTHSVVFREAVMNIAG